MTESLWSHLLAVWDYFHDGYFRFNHRGQTIFLKKRKYARTDITHMTLETNRTKMRLNHAKLDYEGFMAYVDGLVDMLELEQATQGKEEL